MIADRDSAARNAFRVALLTAAPEETPLPVNTTQELDPSDILEVRDMAEAIARAEQIVAAPRSSRPSSRRSATADIFDSLGRRPTDDASGPATPAPASIAPASIATSTLLMRPSSIPHAVMPVSAMMLSLPVAPVPSSTAPVAEDDAYFHPAGRIRSLADVTLDGYRPEPTLLLRARARRKSFTWILGAVLLPIVALAAISVLGAQETATASTATSTTTIATATIVTTATATLRPLPAVTATAATPKPAVTSAKPAGESRESRGAVPVFDVNSLPTAGGRAKTR